MWGLTSEGARFLQTHTQTHTVLEGTCLVRKDMSVAPNLIVAILYFWIILAFSVIEMNCNSS